MYSKPPAMPVVKAFSVIEKELPLMKNRLAVIKGGKWNESR